MIIRLAANEQEIGQAIELYWADEPPINESDKTSALAHWQDIFASCPEGFWVAEDEHTRQLVGVASALRRPPQWLLVNFYVLAAYHGQGIGRSLLAHAMTIREGCDRFAVHASRYASAQGLYMQFGMYPQPYSVLFRGSPRNLASPPSPLVAEASAVADIVSTLNAFDQQALGFTRAVDHQRWSERGTYFVVKVEGRVVGYFQVSSRGIIGPPVVSDTRWITGALDLAIRKQSDISADDHEILVPGANTTAIAHLLTRGYRYADLDLLMSSHPMPSLAQVVFHDMDFL